MKLSSPTTLFSTLLISTPLLVLGAPAFSESAPTLSRRDDWGFGKCERTGEGTCTIYIATSDDDVADYRGAALYDSYCNLLQAVKGSKTTPKLTLKGSLPNYVDLLLDTSAMPNGYISYNSRDIPLGNQDTLGQPMACFKPPNSDGTGCRKAFQCA